MKGPTQKDKKRVFGYINKWRDKLFLNEWHFDVAWRKRDEEPREGFHCMANVSVNFVYMSAKISVFPVFWQKDEKSQEECIAHELVHCLTQEAWDVMGSLHNGVCYQPHVQRDVIERLTQRITNVVFRDEW